MYVELVGRVQMTTTDEIQVAPGSVFAFQPGTYRTCDISLNSGKIILVLSLRNPVYESQLCVNGHDFIASKMILLGRFDASLTAPACVLALLCLKSAYSRHDDQHVTRCTMVCQVSLWLESQGSSSTVKVPPGLLLTLELSRSTFVSLKFLGWCMRLP